MIELDGRQTLIVAILVLFLGKWLNRKVSFLREYNIPEPVTGGVITSLLVGVFYFLIKTEIAFETTDRDTFLLIFFTTIGLSARINTLLEGGKALLLLILCAITYLFLQNITGILVAKSSGLSPFIGLIGGSVSLSGGHGTAIAWSEIFINDYGISNAAEIGIACATFGLILGGLLGGPIAKYLINKYKLKPKVLEEPTVGISHEKVRLSVDYFGVLNTFLIIAIALGIGIELNSLAIYFGLKLPMFVSCLFAGILLTNTVPYLFKKITWPTGSPSLALIADLSLGLFLAISLMSLQLWTLIDLAGPILILLLCQVIVITLFVVLIVFRLLGKDYDAAVISAGYAGMGLGATPTAIANMTAVTKKFGDSPKAFIVVPLVGAFFVDISNAFIIKFLIGILN